MALLSLDVGMRSTGFTVWEGGAILHYGCIHTEKAKGKQVRASNDHAHRAATLARGLAEVCEKWAINGVIGELPSGGAQSANAMKLMALATGAVAAFAELRDLPAEWTDPNSVKLALCGKRSATKDEMMQAALEKFKFRAEIGRAHV